MDPLTAVACTGEDGTPELCSPKVGVFRPWVGEGEAITAGQKIGTLQILGTRATIVAPTGASGVVGAGITRGPVGYCSPLFTLTAAARQQGEGAKAAAQTAAEPTDGVPVRAPIAGIFYNRPSPEEPPYVAVGDRVKTGQTLGLVEVMKTFNPVRLEGEGLPETATVTRVLVDDRAEVAAGDILVLLTP